MALALFLMLIPVAALSQTVQLPKTGQTSCWDVNGIAIACAGTGQDGEKQAGVAWPETRFTDNGNQTMTDNLTGLIWTNDGNAPGPSACGPGVTKTWQGALDYVACLNTNNYLSYSDWRLPNRKELKSLLNRQQSNSAAWLNGKNFSNVRNSYWSSSTDAWGLFYNASWIVYMSHGSVDSNAKTNNYSVWPLRGGQSGTVQLPKTGQTVSYAVGDDGALQKGTAWPNPRFTNNGNGTVTDNLTGLIWLQNAKCKDTSGGVSNEDGFITWANALIWSKGLASGTCELTDGSVAGDWRLPNIEELESLIDLSKYSLALPSGYPFSNVEYSYYWSSSTYVGNTNYVWIVGMSSGYVGSYLKGLGRPVWPVRDVKSGSLNSLYGSFTNFGLYKYEGSAWSPINTVNPEAMTASGGILYANFTNYGLYKYVGGNWTEINKVHPTNMLSSDGKLYATFTGYGFYKYESNAWSPINSVNPDKMTVSGGVLYADFANYGLYKYAGSAWSQINTVRPTNMMSSDGKLYATFADYGFYQYDGTNWIPINSVNPDKMTASGGVLYADFASYGLYKYAGGAWSQINTVRPTNMLSSDGKLYATFTGYGFYQYDNATGWKLINSVNPDSMTISGGILYPVFKDYGFYKYDGATWTQINSVIPNKVVAGE